MAPPFLPAAPFVITMLSISTVAPSTTLNKALLLSPERVTRLLSRLIETSLSISIWFSMIEISVICSSNWIVSLLPSVPLEASMIQPFAWLLPALIVSMASLKVQPIFASCSLVTVIVAAELTLMINACVNAFYKTFSILNFTLNLISENWNQFLRCMHLSCVLS